jgi:phosphatidate phosphatase APP1
MKQQFHRTALRIERILDARTQARADAKPLIVPYRGFGRGNELRVRGRVMAEKNITRARSAEPVWRSVLNAYRRFQSDEIAGATVQASIADAVIDTVTNEEGHFEVILQPQQLDPLQLWHEVKLELAGRNVMTVAHAVVPPADAQFAIVSDIDDTIVRTGATSLRTMIQSVLLHNAASRLPFEGVAELYMQLVAQRNPLFYVSSSPWNLYDLLADYMDLNGIPPGPMFLQDWGLDEVTLIHAAHETHKIKQIQLLLDYYPSLPFVLIGDSGQHDPEIYLQVVRSHPGRVRAVFIRDVTEELRDRAVAALIDEANAAGVPMFYVPDSATVLQHARTIGLVATAPTA